MRMLYLIAVLGSLLPLGAWAEDPAGSWEFRTDIKTKGCTIRGVMSIGLEDPVTEYRDCSFISSETCGPTDPTPVEMEQSCTIKIEGDFVEIRSTVISSLTQGRGIEGYLPDHFTVKPTAPGRMSGTWFDRNYADLVEFWRTRGGATS
ncbi:MAG: hypothetical protein AAF829_05130 [Pseudomonadota bacterium]